MGVNTRRPPLPVPTETGSSMDDTSALGTSTEVATNVTTRTDKTSYSVPEDGSPITIPTQTPTTKDGSLARHGRQKSQTSLLIEYFESAKTGDKSRSRPSVRVKVTPSARKSKTGDGAVQITGIGKDRKPSYTRRISLGGKGTEALGASKGAEISHSSESNLSDRPPVEVEIQHGSDLSAYNTARGLQYAPFESNVSSMPPDSLLEGGNSMVSQNSRSVDMGGEDMSILDEKEDALEVPRRQRSRSLSRERITQKVMAKLKQDSGTTAYKSGSKSGHERSSSFDEYHSNERRRRTSKSRNYDDDTVSGAESSLLSSNANGSRLSYRSDRSQTSRMTNNPKLLEMVEDTIKRMILPEINQIKRDQSVKHGREQSFDYESGSLGRSLSKHSSSPNIKSKPKVVLNRDENDPGTVLSRGDSEYRKMRKSSREHHSRPSSRKSSGRHSRASDGYDEQMESVHHKSSRSGHTLRDTAAAGVAGGVLTAAALKHHTSQSEKSESRERRRRKSSKSHGSRSRSNSIAETTDEAYAYEKKAEVPPLPLGSAINESDVTRHSILSSGTERPGSRAGSADLRTPIREVSRGSLADTRSPGSSRTPTRELHSTGLGMSHANQSIDSPTSISMKAKKAALAAAGLSAARSASQEYEQHVDADGYGSASLSPVTPRRGLDSPAQSVSSLRKGFEGEDSLMPTGLRPQSAASRSSAGRLRDTQHSQSSLQSGTSSPRTKIARSRKQSQNDVFITPMEEHDVHLGRDGTHTPNGESVDEWYERQHELNDRYRDSVDATTNRDSYQTNPYPEDARRFTQYTEDSQEGLQGDGIGTEQGLREVSGLSPQYVRTSFGVESNVASLMEPSNLTTSTVMSSNVESPSKTNGTYSERMAEHLDRMGKDDAAIYEGSTMSQTMPSENRWAAINRQAKSFSNTSKENLASTRSPRQSPAKSLGRERSIEEEPEVQLGASGLPDINDPLPEIGHFDETKSDVDTNPSIIQGHLGGEDAGKNAWPYTPSPAQHERQREVDGRDSTSLKGGHARDAAMLGAVGGGAAAAFAAHHAMKPTVEDDDDGRITPTGERHGDIYIDREATPVSPVNFRDEGYVTNDNRSAGALTPKAQQVSFSRRQVDEFNRAMNAQDLGPEDPFKDNAKHARHISGNSHGMASPLYDSATGHGLDRIQSKDIVALMDHLTVRDAQRNARDTEILVTLVRSATEMRQSFDEMKRFIAEQDRLIMQNTDRDAEQTVHKVLSGPRPQPMSPRNVTPKQSSQEEVQTKRKGVLSRALKGLTRGKSANDLSKIEDMFMQILDEVEDLKQQGGVAGSRDLYSYASESLDSYEKLRAGPDSGYEPEGQAGTNSTPSQSGHFAIPPPKQQFHSGYNGRPGSENRVSTVLEGSEEDDVVLEPYEANVLNQPVLDRDRYPTPTQEARHSYKDSPQGTPLRFNAGALDSPRMDRAAAEAATPKSADKQRKHKSNSSSIFNVPKISRWSRTTASSGAPDPAALDSPVMAKVQRPRSQASRSASTLDDYEDDRYEVHDDDRLPSTQSLAREQERGGQLDETRSMRSQASKITRTPSPLIPSEASYRSSLHQHEREASPIQDDLELEFDDPKYQAHRNSLLLQHPQPRQGPTGRHQNTLETQAHHMFTGASNSGTGSDLSQRTVSDFDPAMWGSSGTAALARNRMSQAEPMSPISMGSGYGKTAPKSGESLIPHKQTQQAPRDDYDDEDDEEDDDEDDEWEPDYSHSGFARNANKSDHYSSPYGSGHLLEPIEEVRYSLETDSGHISLPPTQRLVGGSRHAHNGGGQSIDREISPEPTVASAKAVDMRSPARKITGPRPMGSKSPKPQLVDTRGMSAGTGTGMGTVRRKPVARSQESFDSDTF